MKDDKWFYFFDGKPQGPVIEEELKGILAKLPSGLTTPIWREGMEKWKPAMEVQPFKPTLVPPPLPPRSSGPEKSQTSPPPISGTSQTNDDHNAMKSESLEKSNALRFILFLVIITIVGGIAYFVLNSGKDIKLSDDGKKKEATIKTEIIKNIIDGGEGFTVITNKGRYPIYIANAVQNKSELGSEIYNIAVHARKNKIPVIIEETNEYNLGYKIRLADGQSVDTKKPDLCLPLNDKNIVLSGMLYKKIYPGPPNFQSVARGDRPEVTYILKLDNTICTKGDDMSGPEKNVKEVGIQCDVDCGEYNNKNVSIKGDLWGGHTMHHHRKVMMTATAIESRQHYENSHEDI